MKTKSLFAGLFMAALTITSCSKGATEAKAPETFTDSVAMYQGIFSGAQALETYASMPDSVKAKFDKEKFLAGIKLILEADTSLNFQDGMQMGMQMMGGIYQAKSAGMELKSDVLFAYFEKIFRADSVNHAEMEKMGPEMEKVMLKYQEKMQTYQYDKQREMEAQMQQIYEKNVAEGKKFMETLKKDPAVKTTESGLAYKVEKQGDGAVAKDGDTVNVIYTGKTIDGNVFDSSENQVVPFEVDQVVPGFKEALKLFPAGSKVTLYIPQELGYGMGGSRAVAPGATMVFDMEIVGK